MVETAEVHHDCSARPLARFSYDKTSAGYNACKGVQPREKNTMKRTAK
jgi:hypothetical protein